MSGYAALRRFCERCARLLDNLRHINLLQQRVLLGEARQQMLEQAAGNYEQRQLLLEQAAGNYEQRQLLLEQAAGKYEQRQLLLEQAAGNYEQRQLLLEQAAGNYEQRQLLLEQAASKCEQRQQLLEQGGGNREQRLCQVETGGAADRQRLAQLELNARLGRQRMAALEGRVEMLGRDLERLESALLPVIEQASAQQMHQQLQLLRKGIEQEKLFTSAAPRRPRLAFVSPLPPERSGISDYSAELLPELARHYDIDVILAQPSVADAWINTYCPLRSVAWFRQHAADYERVLYQFGNSPCHSHMFALLREHPGVVVLHDFFLGDVLEYEERSGALPGAWANALLHSHGYLALKTAGGPNGVELARQTYPCNLEVLENARAVIVHSEHSRQLARLWYGAHAADDWRVIALLRTPVAAFERAAARRATGLGESAFVVCSFGFIDPVKLTHRLLDAWLASSLCSDPDCVLVLTGANHPGAYGAQLSERIRNSAGRDRIHITGWVAETSYRQYLQAADAGVQLRGLSRGETSAAVLDCLNHALPTIVNCNGSMAELAPDAVWTLPDAFDDADLVTALESLRKNRGRRAELGAAARQFIGSRHDPRQCASLYAQAIEGAYAKAGAAPAGSNGSAAPALAPRQLLIDVSAIVRCDLHTGIERVVRAQLSVLLNEPPPGFRVEPVYLSEQGGNWHYRYARTYACGLLGVDAVTLDDAPLAIGSRDVFYAPDFFPEGVLQAARCGMYAQWRALGVKINFLIHDLLPLQMPQFFPAGVDAQHARWLACIADNADCLICVSAQVAADLGAWLNQRAPAGQPAPGIAVVHHGADLAASHPSAGMPENAAPLLAQLAAAPSFLMVGTIEPRKGHLQTLSAFEQLWREGSQARLVLVGAEGWIALPQHQRRTIPEIVDRLRHHPELGQRLFWLHGISDEYLQKVYGACTCLVFASEGEGFGLPLIEAARHALPIIARNLPVCREVAGENACYFEGLAANDLAAAIRTWLERKSLAADAIPWLERKSLAADAIPWLERKSLAADAMPWLERKSLAVDAIPWITWKQNVGQLLAVLAA